MMGADYDETIWNGEGSISNDVQRLKRIKALYRVPHKAGVLATQEERDIDWLLDAYDALSEAHRNCLQRISRLERQLAECKQAEQTYIANLYQLERQLAVVTEARDGAIANYTMVLNDNDRLRGQLAEAQRRIETPCPSCGNRGTLFVGKGGHLTCSWLPCKEPAPQRVWEQAEAERDQLGERVKALEEKITVMRYDEQQELIHALRERLAELIRACLQAGSWFEGHSDLALAELEHRAKKLEAKHGS
jgi:cell division septum initiation protein DivIVA